VESQRRFTKLEPKIRRALAGLLSKAGSHEAPFRSIAAATLVQYAMDLRKRLGNAAAAGPADLHATRIAAKRLRYLLEPVEQRLAGGAGIIDRLKQLQDLCGGLTDAHELRGELRRAASTDQATGITAATTLLDAEVKGFLTTVREDWSGAGSEIEKEVVAAVRALSPSPRPPSPSRRSGRRRSRVPA
jgi:CHAD domain-containing protein